MAIREYILVYINSYLSVMDYILQPKDILAEWYKPRPIYVFAIIRDPPALRDTYGLKVRMEKIFHANVTQKKAGVAIPDRIDLKIKTVTRDKEGHYLMTSRDHSKEKI